MVSSNVTELLSWRVSFAWLSIPGILLAWRFNRLPEPARGGRGQLARGQEQVTGIARGDEEADARGRARSAGGDAEAAAHSAQRVVREADSEPRPEMILREDPRHMSVWRAFGYVLRIPTVLLMISASALGYFFFAASGPSVCCTSLITTE